MVVWGVDVQGANRLLFLRHVKTDDLPCFPLNYNHIKNYLSKQLYCYKTTRKGLEINPSILTWARETAGLGLEEAADRLGFKSSEKMSAEEKLRCLEAGEQAPSRNQLAKIASLYRRPLITFYMKEPPIRGERGEDFRRPSGHISRRENGLLDALLRDVKARQEMVKNLLEDDEDPDVNQHVASAKITDGIDKLVSSISEALQFDFKSLSARKGNADDLFKSLRTKAEAAGIFVLLIGDVGSHHSAISSSVFRGFAIADKIAPFIVINDQDARSARSFTLIHELTHIWLGQSGVSGTPEISSPANSHETIERFCNDVAGEFLLPSESLGSRPEALKNRDKQAALNVVSGLAEIWSVSEPMVAYRLNRIGWIDQAIYQSLVSEYMARWMASRSKTKKSDGGPSYYVVKQNKLGNALIEVVRRTLRENLITHTKAAKVLGVKASSVEPLLRGYEKSRGQLVHETRR